MIKQAPSRARIAAMIGFTLSCFGIVLFLWIQFGGSTPLRPEGYRVEVAFPEAIGLNKDVDVRAAGITVGTVRKVEVDHESNRVLATLELEPRYAPLASDARAILRRKTLLGETFVEITTGTRDAPKLADGGRLEDSRVGETVELDEVLQTYDEGTRRAFQLWQQELAVGLRGRGEDLNNAIGQLPELTDSAGDLLAVLDSEEDALRGLVRDTGAVYEALTRDEGQLANLIRNSHGVFRQAADQRGSLREAFQIFPTFLAESKATLERAERFSRNTRPLVRDLRPVANELRPTVRAVRRFAPPLKRFFVRFDDQIRVSRRSLPALRQVFEETGPMFRSLGPFLGELNPIFEWLELNQLMLSDFLSYSPGGIADTVDEPGPGEVGHYLRQLGMTGLESLAIHQNRLSSNRGNAYLPPVFTGREVAQRGILPNWDCNNAGGERPPQPGPVGAQPACFMKPNLIFKGKRQGRLPHVEAESYRPK
jgi:phospholipid/cholesterol/gamma-HCH transport system substrate-binding protein